MFTKTEKITKIEIIFDENYAHLDDRDTQATDLLVDLQHFCEIAEVSFDKVIGYARIQYSKEKDLT